jgi:hypothetical protein
MKDRDLEDETCPGSGRALAWERYEPTDQSFGCEYCAARFEAFDDGPKGSAIPKHPMQARS